MTAMVSLLSSSRCCASYRRTAPWRRKETTRSSPCSTTHCHTRPPRSSATAHRRTSRGRWRMSPPDWTRHHKPRLRRRVRPLYHRQRRARGGLLNNSPRPVYRGRSVPQMAAVTTHGCPRSVRLDDHMHGTSRASSRCLRTSCPILDWSSTSF